MIRIIFQIAVFTLFMNPAFSKDKSKNPIVFLLTEDISGPFKNSGTSDLNGIIDSLEDFISENKKLLGRDIVYFHVDTPSPDSVKNLSEFIKKQKVAFIIGAINSSTADAIAKIAQKMGIIFFNTNSSSPKQSGVDCHRTKFVWDGSGSNFMRALVSYVPKKNKGRFTLLYSDYDWGINTSNVIKDFVLERGHEVAAEIKVPLGQKDFSDYIESLKGTRADGIFAAVAGEDIIFLNQQREGIPLAPFYFNQADYPDVYLSPRIENGIFATTWYHKLPLAGIREFVEKFKKRHKNSILPVPGNIYYNGYMATKVLLESIKKLETTDNHALIGYLEKWRSSKKERMQDFDAYMDQKNHHVQQAVYVVKTKKEKEKGDIFEIIKKIRPEEIVDTDSREKCRLESMESTRRFVP